MPGATAGRRKAASCALLALAATAQATEPRIGERLYREGLNARSEPIRALVGMPPSPLLGGRAACGACHGGDGRGSPAAPDVRWSALEAGAPSGDGARPYSERTFARSVNEGIDPRGAPVAASMPRYSLSNSEIAALAAFLKTLR